MPSLVGSEMCIRDRSSRPPALICALHASTSFPGTDALSWMSVRTGQPQGCSGAGPGVGRAGAESGDLEVSRRWVLALGGHQLRDQRLLLLHGRDGALGQSSAEGRAI